jgi:multiple sugar transport system permease protein
MIFYILITSVIGVFKTYTSVVAIIGTEGRITTGAAGPVDMRTIVFYVYRFLDLAGEMTLCRVQQQQQSSYLVLY